MTPKQKALSICKAALANVQDDVYRAKRSFANFTQDQMKEQHGFSNYSRQEILDCYLNSEREIQAAVEWANRQSD